MIFVMIIKLTVLITLFIPMVIASCIVWAFGGWTRGWDDMPNPLYALLNWATDI